MLSIEHLAKNLNKFLSENDGIHRQVHNLSVFANCAKIVIRGISSNYYQKQMTQEIVIKFLENRALIKNEITVKTRGII